MDEDRCRSLFAAARCARLATVRSDGSPHVVPIVHALLPDDRVVFAVDGKPKRTERLQRLVNLEHDDRVSILADHFEEDWQRLWWVRADGTARIVDDPIDRDRCVGSLLARYPQYRTERPRGPVVAIRVTRWSGWAAHP